MALGAVLAVSCVPPTAGRSRSPAHSPARAEYPLPTAPPVVRPPAAPPAAAVEAEPCTFALQGGLSDVHRRLRGANVTDAHRLLASFETLRLLRRFQALPKVAARLEEGLAKERDGGLAWLREATNEAAAWGETCRPVAVTLAVTRAQDVDAMTVRVAAAPHAALASLFAKLATVNEGALAKRLRSASLPGSGSGFVVIRVDGKTTSKLVVTNHHVVAGSDSVGVVSRGKTYPGRVVFDHHESDLAVLDVPTLPHETGFGIQTDLPKQGARVLSIGYPVIDGRPTFRRSEGVVLGLQPSNDSPTLLVTDVASAGGSSGSPLIDSDGRVVGVVRGRIQVNAAPWRNMSIPARHLESALTMAQGNDKQESLQNEPRLACLRFVANIMTRDEAEDLAHQLSPALVAKKAHDLIAEDATVPPAHGDDDGLSEWLSVRLAHRLIREVNASAPVAVDETCAGLPKVQKLAPFSTRFRSRSSSLTVRWEWSGLRYRIVDYDMGAVSPKDAPSGSAAESMRLPK